MKLLFLSLFLEIIKCPIHHTSSYKEYNTIKPTSYPLLKDGRFKPVNGYLRIYLPNNKSVIFSNVFSQTDETTDKTYEYLGNIKSIDSYFVNEIGYEIGSVIMMFQQMVN